MIMMIMAAALIQCMIRTGSGCSRSPCRAFDLTCAAAIGRLSPCKAMLSADYEGDPDRTRRRETHPRAYCVTAHFPSPVGTPGRTERYDSAGRYRATSRRVFVHGAITSDASEGVSS